MTKVAEPGVKDEDAENEKQLEKLYNDYYSKIHAIIFPGLPEHYPLKKKMLMTKNNTSIGKFWDISQVLFSLLACAMYVANLYFTEYKDVQKYKQKDSG